MENVTPSRLKQRLYYCFILISAFATVMLTTSFDKVPEATSSDWMFTDSDGDGVPDNTDIDDDNDGIIDLVEDQNPDGDNNPATNPTDTDGDSVPDYLDIDSDNDGILDNVEAQLTAGFQPPCGIDTDGNGLDDHYEAHPGACGGLVPVDTDTDGVPDYVDIDSDNDGILDNVESQTDTDFQPPCGIDTDGNGLDDHYENHPGSGEGITPLNTDMDAQPDFRDIDSDNDGILDNVEAQDPAHFQPPCGLDTDGNGLDDHYEDHPGSGEGLTPGNSDNCILDDYRDIDADNDGIPDNVEGQTTAGYVPPTGLDDDEDGLDNAYEGAGDEGITPVNTDGTDNPDYLDDDSDNDLVPDNNEGNDFDFDGVPNQSYTGTDTDGDGLDDGFEGSDLNDGFDVNDEIDDPANDLPDTDGTDDVNYRDIDDDGDTIDTPDEDADTNGDPTNDDTDTDGTPDYLDPDQGNDTDGDGVTDDDETTDGTDHEDLCDFVLEHQTVTTSDEWDALDCDGDGVTNEDEVADGTDPLDECDFLLASQSVDTSDDWNDLDCDGDGVTNEDEVEDGTDPLDPCDLLEASITLDPSESWNSLDCDNDGNPNGTDPHPLEATANDDSGTTQPLTELIIDILANDDYLPNNNPNNLGITNITRIGGSAAGEVVFDADTGEVSYLPPIEEASSIVTIVYEVCNTVPEPDVCASATISISVTKGSIDAVDDEFFVSIADATTGGTMPDINVLDNDTLGGDPVLAFEIILTSTTTGPLTINEDGTIDVAPGTPPDTYTIEYTICEIADPTNCDTAATTVNVVNVPPPPPPPPGSIDAVDDEFSVSIEDAISGGTIPDINVLDNDTLDGLAVEVSEIIVTSTTTGPLTINEDGTIDVSPGTAQDTYTIEYTICEIADPSNCDTATTTVEVLETPLAAIDAVDDDFSAEVVDGIRGGIVSDSNVLDNDTLNGAPVNPEDVVLTSFPSGPLSINDDGTVSVAPLTEDGTYTIEYMICEVASPGNCDTATVTIEVSGMVEVNQMVTPNGDGKNDFLFIRGIRNLPNNSLKIYNRWGVAVYEGNNYNNQNNVFDGRSKTRSTVSAGDYLPAGIYFYIFEYQKDQERKTNNGYLYISK